MKQRSIVVVRESFLTDGQLEYMDAHPKEPMNMETFAECIKHWHERGCPTKKDTNLKNKKGRKNESRKA
jgi:hypothetical protein